MAIKILHKRTSTPGKVPQVSDIQLGEFALNSYDGKVFFKMDNGAENIVKIIDSKDIDNDNKLTANSSLIVPSQHAVHDAVNLSYSTGVIFGGILSVASSTTISITDGEGIIVDNVSGNRNHTMLSWTGLTNIPIVNITTQNVTYIAVNGSGQIIQQATKFTSAQSRTLVSLGTVVHSDFASILLVNNQQQIVLSPLNQLQDLAKSIGFINKRGNVISPNGMNLQLNKTPGEVFGIGMNYLTNQADPNIIILPELTAFSTQYRTQTGISGSDVTAINPNIYDLNGTFTTVPTNKFTVQRLYLFGTNNIRIQPGQTLYDSLAEAKRTVRTQMFVTETNIFENSLLRAILIVKEGTTDLTNTNNAFFIEAGLFSTTTGLGGISVSTLQDAYNNALLPKITTGSAGAVQIKNGSVTDTDHVLEIVDHNGTVTFFVRGDGVTSIQPLLDDKVDKVAGYSLSKHDFTDALYDEVLLKTDVMNDLNSVVHISGGTITPTGGVNFNISSGYGYAKDITGKYIKVIWGSINTACINNGDNFINIDNTGNVSITSSASDGSSIALGYISTSLGNTVIVGYSNTHLTGKDHLFRIGDWIRRVLGSLVESGVSTSMQASPNQLKVVISAGSIWTLLNRYIVPDKSTFLKLYNTSNYGFVQDTTTTANEVNTAFYNVTTNGYGSALVAMTTGYYKKDMIVLTPEGTAFYVYATTQWATLDEAKVAPIPLVPENIRLSVVRSAALVSQQGATVVDTVLDIRPKIDRLFETGAAASNATVISHSDLINLSNDDHIQYHTDGRGDVRYYRKTEITTLLAGKANSSHTHLAADITDLSKTSVGLSNVLDLDQTNATNLASGTVANARLTTHLRDLGNLTLTTNDLFQYNGSAIVNITLAQLKTSLTLNNVVNSLQVINAGNGVSFASGTNSSKASASINGRLFATTDNGIYLDNGSGWVLQQAAITGDISISANNTVATLATVNSNVGTFNNVTVNAKGLVTAASNVSYLTANQTVTLSGDFTGSGTTAITGTLATVNSNVGTFGSTSVVPVVTVNAKGLVTAVTTAALTSSSVGLGNLTNSLQVINAGGAVSIASGLDSAKPAAALVGKYYNSTDQGAIYRDNGTTWQLQVPAHTGDVTSTANNTALTLATVNSNIGTFNNVTVNAKGLVTAASNVSYLTANQTVTLSGDFTGSGTTAITGTLATVNSNVGTFGSTSAVSVITVNAKGLVTAVSTAALTSSSVGLGNLTNSLQVINAGGAVSIATGTNASKPIAGTSGRQYYSTDQGITYFDNGTTWAAKLPAYTGDVTSSLSGTVLTLATVNSNVGTFNNLTVNAKGLVTAASNANYLGDTGANGIVVRTALNTTTGRTLTGTTNQITITNGDGTGGNPTIAIASNPVIPGTASLTLPTGTTAQRDTPTNGQIRYNSDLGYAEISDTGVYRPIGKVAQIITGDIVQTTGTTILPYDATIPLSTEGFQIWTVNITPTYTTSKIIVIFNVASECSVAGTAVTMVLFNGTTAISTSTGMMVTTASSPFALGISKSFTSGTTSAITLSGRIGPSAAATVYVNRGNTETFAGTTNTSYIIMEIV